MSYDTKMFRLIADEAKRIAENGDCAEIDEEDLYTMASALGEILSVRSYKSVESCAADFVACSLGGMYEVFQFLPEIKRDLIEALMKDEGYSYMDNEWLTMWVKKED